MIGRKTMGNASPIFLILLALGFFIAMYNLVTLVINSQNREAVKEMIGIKAPDPILEMPNELKKSVGRRRPFHVALTATDAPYNKWQCRIMYYWYKKMKEMEGSEMGGFTRVLHSGNPDELMGEIPTFVVNPLPAGMDRTMGFCAMAGESKDRRRVFDYILMAEPDHIFVNPFPNLSRGGYPAAYPFFYIKPSENEKVIRKFYPEEKGHVTDIDPIGNSPVIIQKSQLEKIAPTWMNVSLKMKNDPETDQAFGWVLEMYAYAVASALHGVSHILRKDFMIQPPWDLKVGKTFIIHYTYGCDYSLKVTLVNMVNEATANIPGWDDGRRLR